VDLANQVFEPPASRGSAIQTDFCRPSARVFVRRMRGETQSRRRPSGGSLGRWGRMLAKTFLDVTNEDMPDTQ
jgi:hypothetical protein